MNSIGLLLFGVPPPFFFFLEAMVRTATEVVLDEGIVEECGVRNHDVDDVAAEPTIRVLLTSKRLLQKAKERWEIRRDPSMVVYTRLQSKLT